jgi:hypothetical protein
MTKINYILTLVSGYNIHDEIIFIGTAKFDKKANQYGFMCIGKRLVREPDESWEEYWLRKGWSVDYFKKYWQMAPHLLDEIEHLENNKHYCFEEHPVEVNRMALEVWEEMSSNNDEQVFTNMQNMYFLKYLMIKDRFLASVSSVVFDENLPEWLAMCQIKDVLTLEETLVQVGVDTQVCQTVAHNMPIIKTQSPLMVERLLLDEFNYILYLTDVRKLDFDKNKFNAKLVLGLVFVGIVIGYCAHLVHLFVKYILS